MPSIKVFTDAGNTAARMRAMAEWLPVAADIAAINAADAAVKTFEPALRQETLVDTGLLRASSYGSVVPINGGAAGEMRQPARNVRDEFYAGYLIGGYDLVFFGNPTGKHIAPKDYPAKAWRKAAGEVLIAVQQAVSATVRVWRG